MVPHFNFSGQVITSRQMPTLKEKLSERTEAREFNGLGWLLVLLVLALFSAAIIYFGGNNYGNSSDSPHPTATRAPRTYSIFYDNGFFQPTNLRIHSGDTVRFINKDVILIKIASGLSDFNSQEDIGKDEAFVYTFTKVGIFSYYNGRNQNETGTIIVR